MLTVALMLRRCKDLDALLFRCGIGPSGPIGCHPPQVPIEESSSDSSTAKQGFDARDVSISQPFETVSRGPFDERKKGPELPGVCASHSSDDRVIHGDL